MTEDAMSGFEEFYWHEVCGARFPAARLRADRFRPLADLLTSDIQTDAAGALDALYLVEPARGGRGDIEEWLGNATCAYFRPDGVTITDLGPDPQTQRYSLDEVHDALIQYWEFLCPGAGERRGSLRQWARYHTWEHPQTPDPRHPCLSHLPW